MRVVCTALSLLAALPGLGAQSPADRALDRAVAAYRNVRTVRTPFEQTLTNPVTSRVSNARGEMIVQRPGKISVGFSEPSGDRIVSDGKFVWIYLPSSAPGQVIKQPASAVGAGLDFSTELLTAPRDKFTVSDGGVSSAAGRGAYLVVLTPKAESAFTKARIWVDDRDGLVRQLELTEPSGLTRLLKFGAMKLNAKVPSSAFTFKVPKGVKVYAGGA
jgi:outer membrane lipoprotein carrier protein